MARQDNTRAAIGKALEEVVMRARCGKKPCRLGLMAAGSELPLQEFLCAARDAMEADPALRITGLGPPAWTGRRRKTAVTPQRPSWMPSSPRAGSRAPWPCIILSPWA